MHLKKVTLCPEKFPTKEHYPFNLILIQETKSLTLAKMVPVNPPFWKPSPVSAVS
jgi:hypothetical protein